MPTVNSSCTDTMPNTCDITPAAASKAPLRCTHTRTRPIKRSSIRRLHYGPPWTRPLCSAAAPGSGVYPTSCCGPPRVLLRTAHLAHKAVANLSGGKLLGYCHVWVDIDDIGARAHGVVAAGTLLAAICCSRCRPLLTCSNRLAVCWLTVGLLAVSLLRRVGLLRWVAGSKLALGLILALGWRILAIPIKSRRCHLLLFSRRQCCSSRRQQQSCVCSCRPPAGHPILLLLLSCCCCVRGSSWVAPQLYQDLQGTQSYTQ